MSRSLSARFHVRRGRFWSVASKGVFLLWGAALLGGWGKQKPDYTHITPWPDTGAETIDRIGIPGFLGGDMLRVGEGCVLFSGFALPGEFFHKLKRFETTRGFEFRNGKTILTDFPDEVFLRITVVPARCSEHDPRIVDWRLDPPELLKTPGATAGSIRGLRTQPIDITLAEEGLEKPQFGARVGAWWFYRFVVRTKGIRLADPLVISLYSRDGRKLAQLTLRL